MVETPKQNITVKIYLYITLTQTNPQEVPSAAVEQLRDAEREKLTLCRLECCFVCVVCCICV